MSGVPNVGKLLRTATAKWQQQNLPQVALTKWYCPNAPRLRMYYQSTKAKPKSKKARLEFETEFAWYIYKLKYNAQHANLPTRKRKLG